MLQAAQQLQEKGVQLHSEIVRIISGVPKVAAAVERIGLPSPPAVSEMTSSAGAQQLTAFAAAVIDAVVPVSEAEFGDQVEAPYYAQKF